MDKVLIRPSRRVHGLGRRAAVVAHKRQTKPPSLERKLRGDLDSIAMKAIEKERERRYDDVIALSEDLERYLNNKPVSAGRPGFGRRIRKFLRRHHFASVAIVGLAIGSALATSVGLAA